MRTWPRTFDATTAAQFWHVKWFIAWLVLSYALSRRIALSHLVLVIGFGALALLGNRNLLLFYWVATPIAALQLAPAARHVLFGLRRYRAPSLMRVLSRVTLAGLLSLAASAAARETDLGKPVPFRFPTASAAILAERTRLAPKPSQASIFCADQQGGYLIWTLYPQFKPYIDTRLVLRSAERYSEYLALAEDPESFGPFADKQAISYVVLPVAYPDRYLGLIAYLYHNPDWRLIFTDGAEVLFTRRELTQRSWSLADPATTARVLAQIERQYRALPQLHDAALIQFAMLDVALQEFAEAERVLSHSQSAAGRALRARALFAAGDLDAAQALAERGGATERANVRDLVLVAMVYGRRGRLQQALHYLRRALAIDPLDGEALGLLATLEAQQHEH
jgi:tetratricopeptide (TPR) repeat protein